MKIANEFFSWFQYELICSDVRALNATFYVHSTPNSITGKGYCSWRSQMNYLADSSTSPYVLMLERWILPFPYIQRQTVLLVRNIVSEDYKWVFLAHLITSSYVLMLERWMLPYSYIQRPTVLLIRDNVHEDHKWIFLADLRTSPYVVMLERWFLPFSYIQRQTVLLVRNIMCEDCKWVI